MRRVRKDPAYKIQRPDQRQLIEQIVLEPQDDLIASCTGLDYGAIGTSQPRLYLSSDVAVRTQKAAPHLMPGVALDRRARPFVQNIRHDHHPGR